MKLNKKLIGSALLVGLLSVSTVYGAFLSYKGFVEIFGTKYPLGIVELETQPIAPVEGLEAREDYLGEIRVWTYSNDTQMVLQLMQLSEIVTNFRIFTVKVCLPLDVVFVVGLAGRGTGCGSCYIKAVKTELTNLMWTIERMHKCDVQAGVVGFNDYPDETVSLPLTSDLGAVESYINGLEATDGVGSPQSHYLGFQKALELFQDKPESWSHDRIVVFISDAEPGVNDSFEFAPDGPTVSSVLALAEAGIKVHAVLWRSDTATENEIYRWYADVTGGHFIHGLEHIAPGVTRDPTWIVKLTSITPFDSFRLPLASSAPTQKEGFYTFRIYVDFWCKAVPWHEKFLTELAAHLEKAETPPHFPPPEFLKPGPEAVADIGPEGGVVEVTDPESPIYGLRLDIPAGAVREMTTISVDDLPEYGVDSILSAQRFTSAQKHMLGGFLGEPDGLVFDVPVQVSVPVDPLSTDGGVPVQAKVLVDEEVYWLEPTDLVYDPIEGRVEMIIQDFSGHAVVELEELLKPPEERGVILAGSSVIPCEELRIHVTSFFVGFAGGDGCQIVGDFVWVKFLDCPGEPTEEAHIFETTPECGPDFSLKVEVDPPSAMLFPCKTETLKARVYHKDKSVIVPVIWENIGDAGVAEVDMRTGIVKGLRDGETVIRALTPDPRYYGECRITVVGHVCEVDVAPSSDDIFAGETLPLTALPKDVDGNTPPRDRFGNEVEGLIATWRSTDDAIATVDSNGVVNGVSPGTVKIIATVEGVEGFASITVKEPGRVVIVPSSVTISVRETQHFEVTVYDKDGYELPDYPVEWIIPPSEVIAFDAVTQTVRGVSPGIAVITATGEGASASATITVTPVEVGSVVIVPEEATISVGETITLEVTVYDKDGNELPGYPVEWTIPPGGIVAFNHATQTVTGVSPGTAEITATCEGKSASATITVTGEVKYRLTWKATVGWCVENDCFDPGYCWEDRWWYRESRDKVFEGYAVIEEVTDTGNTTYQVTDFWANGHSERHTVLWEAYEDLYNESVVQWEAQIYDLTDNGKDQIKQRIEDNFQVLRYPNGSFMKTPNPTRYFFPSILSPRYEALLKKGEKVVHPAGGPPYSEYIIYDTYREYITDFHWYPYLCRGIATERPEPKFIEYDETTQTFHLEIEQGALDIRYGWCGCMPCTTREFIIVYADHSRCVSDAEYGVCNGFWSIAYWEINVEVIDEAAASSLSAASLTESQIAYASPYTDIDVATAQNMITDNGYPDIVVLDVRTQSEYDNGYIYGAILIPHTELDERIEELAGHENHEIIVYCGTGARSAIASEILDSHNFTKVHNMLGGISSWQSAGYPVHTLEEDATCACPREDATFWGQWWFRAILIVAIVTLSGKRLRARRKAKILELFRGLLASLTSE